MKKSYILIVEDEKAIAELIAINLRHAGFECDMVHDGIEAKNKVYERTPDLVLLDWMLPGVNGLSLAKYWRSEAEKKLMPIIFLTAKADESDTILALNSGADDYIIKPFSLKNLLARVHACLRRNANYSVPSRQSSDCLSCGVISIYMPAHRVTAAEHEVKLSPTEYKLLMTLLQHSDKVLSREDLQTRVWGRASVIDSRTIDVHIKRLRQALASVNRAAADQVKTIRGFGYKLAQAE